MKVVKGKKKFLVPVSFMVLALFGCAAGRHESDRQNLPQVTVPNGSTPDKANAPHAPMNDKLRYSGWNYGNDALWVYIPEDAIYTISDDDRSSDGHYRLKIGWWRGIPGQLTVTGRKLNMNTPSPPLRYNAGSIEEYGDIGFVPSILFLPSPGYWEITGHVGDKSLTIIIHVIKKKK